MTLVLDSGGITSLAAQRTDLFELRRRGHWPPVVPAVVLTEALTGDHRRDFAANQLLKTCQILEVDEILSRRAARMRTATGQADKISAVDAIVVACADVTPEPVVLTSDPRDLGALAEQATRGITVMWA